LTRFDNGDHKYITEIGPKIPEFEDTLNPRRILYLKKTDEGSQSPDEILNEKIGELLNAAEETSEYIQQTNAHFDKQKLKVDELKKLQRIFEKQISALESSDDEKADSG
jgi:hypothetical protein